MRRLRALVMGLPPDSALHRELVKEREEPKQTFATSSDLDRLAAMGG